MWDTIGATLGHGPTPGEAGNATGLLLGRIQSGKTTAMTGMAALAHDMGYRLVIAVLGTTNLLLTQNTSRLLSDLGLSSGLTSDYSWVHLDPSLSKQRLGREITHALGSGQTVLITVLKHSRRLRSLAEHLDRLNLNGVSALILDDEADQASLNTMVAVGEQSPTYRALVEITSLLPSHLYVQVTATPFAPLLLDAGDLLSPSFVEFLEPGPGYTGAKEFFVDEASTVVRLVAAGEAMRQNPTQLPLGLMHAFANYLLGASHLLVADPTSAPVSMLVHPTHRIAVHERIAVLLRRKLTELRESFEAASDPSQLPEPFPSEYQDLLNHGVPSVGGIEVMEQLRRVSRLAKISVVNSTVEQDSVVWSSSPAHILVGGNKLDRGFTVEGLTVSYLSRSTSTQADTLAQRARAFGYRKEYLPYCRFFANSSTVDAFRSSVQTDEAMRIELRQWIADGRDLADWSSHVGFMLGDGLTPTRRPVAPWLSRSPSRGWHVLANPDMSGTAQSHNATLLAELGILTAPRNWYGRLTFRTLHSVPILTIAQLIRSWSMPERSGWSRSDIASFVERVAAVQPKLIMDVVLLDGKSDGEPRVRSWRPTIGFSNLMQGRDLNFQALDDQYPGDRTMFGDGSGLQIHWLQPREGRAEAVFTLALHIGDEITAATEVRRA
jgi:hypothetical protein